mmetsp:Transcript_35993/g.73424  ORF Transcript_35993/g.73424 Transcript_35993/m.73424 type:complete len:415 (-) Transcript_35993:249-1493(-)
MPTTPVPRGAYSYYVIVLCLLLKLSVSSSFQIGPLLSTCVDACDRGCTEIRKVQAARETNDDNFLKVELKDAQDPRSALTEADEAAHRAIVGSLREAWGDELRIVGEEDDDEDLANTLAEMTFEPPLDRDLFVDEIGETADIDASKITIFVDPLDGTREFVEGRLENCQVLVGIAIDGKAIAGAVGIPFLDGTMDNESTVIYGIDGMGTGVKGATLTRGPYPLDKHIDGVKYPRPHHATGDSTAEVMDACRQRTIKRFGGSTVIYGGAGNKILAAALGEVSCSIQHKVGGPVSFASAKFDSCPWFDHIFLVAEFILSYSVPHQMYDLTYLFNIHSANLKWDLCAPEAILKAMGGKMTDLFGEEIQIYRDDAPTRCNERGYLASAPGSEEIFHEALAANMVALDAVQKYKEEIEA